MTEQQEPTATYELKLANGQIVRWQGRGPTDAATRYADMHPGTVVVAWRHPKTDLVIGMQRIDG